METQSRVLEIGLSAISHIYKLAFFLSKNVATAVCHCQKGMYCYLEYIEQMNKNYKLSHTENEKNDLILVISVIFRTPTDGVKNTVIKFKYRIAST
jgi:hypothetical protein